MARPKGFCCLMSQCHGDTNKSRDRRSGAACICCIGRHHRPAGGGSCGPCLTPKVDLSVNTPLTGCCGSGDRGCSSSRTPCTPKTPCTPSARRLCGVRSRTPRPEQVCCFSAPPTAAPPAAAPARTPRTPKTPLSRPQRVCCVRGPAQGKTKLGRRRRWFRCSARQAVAQPPCRTARPGSARANGDVKIYNPLVAEAEAAMKEETCENDEYALLCREGFSREDVAAVTIQAYFRRHLARRAFKALKSLVKLQAVARGVYVRRQAEVAIHCMQAMVRLQMRVRARQMLTKCKEVQLLQS